MDFYVNPHIAGIDAAGALPDLPVNRGDQIRHQQIVGFLRASHGEHFAVEVFALILGFALDFEVLFRSQECPGLRGHRLL